MNNFFIIGGRVIDPANRRDGFFDVQVRDGKIGRVAKGIRAPKNAEILDARGMWVLPGFVDAHVHLREPGNEQSETIKTGTQAAAAGGVTSLLCMANTQPTTDTSERARSMMEKIKRDALVRVQVVGAVTQNLEGKILNDFAAMSRAGVRAFSDDGKCVMNSRLLRQALEQCKKLDRVLIEHCEDENLSQGGIVHEGALSQHLGCLGIASESEAIIVARDIFLARLTGARLHLAHMSTKDSVHLIRWARKIGVKVTAEVCPHYFALTDAAIKRWGTHAKMKPPLRARSDLQAIKAALADGTIDAIATDHAPHHAVSKALPLNQAPFGIIGLESSFALVYNELVLKKIITPMRAVHLMTNAANIFDLDAGKLSSGSNADMVIFDPQKNWTHRAETLHSKSKNTPFEGRKFKGKIIATFVGGKKVYGNF